jgi:hypothetical protein
MTRPGVIGRVIFAAIHTGQSAAQADFVGRIVAISNG